MLGEEGGRGGGGGWGMVLHVGCILVEAFDWSSGFILVQNHAISSLSFGASDSLGLVQCFRGPWFSKLGALKFGEKAPGAEVGLMLLD